MGYEPAVKMYCIYCAENFKLTRQANELKTFRQTQRERAFITGNKFIFCKWVRLSSNIVFALSFFVFNYVKNRLQLNREIPKSHKPSNLRNQAAAL